MPIVDHLHKIFGLTTAISRLIIFCRSDSFLPLSQLKVDAVAVPTEDVQTIIDVQPESLGYAAYRVAEDACDGFPIDDWFADFFQARLVGPVTAAFERLRQASGPRDHDHDHFLVREHPECALLRLAHEYPGKTVPYIGLSELSCLVCYEFLKAHHTFCSNKVYVRGSSALAPFTWGFPTLPCESTHELLTHLTCQLHDDFQHVFTLCYFSEQRTRVDRA